MESSGGRERTNKKEKDELCHLKIGIFVCSMAATSLTIRLEIGVQLNVPYFEEKIKYDEIN